MRRLWMPVTIAVVVGAIIGVARVPARSVGDVREQEAKAQAPAARSVPLEPGAMGIRILFGLRDSLPTQWSGSIAVTGASLISLEGWHFRQVDHFTGATSWAAFTRFGAAATRRREAGPNNPNAPVLPNGVIAVVNG